MKVRFFLNDRFMASMDCPEAPSPGNIVRISYKRTTQIYKVVKSEMMGDRVHTTLVRGEAPGKPERKLPANDNELLLAYSACDNSFAATARLYGCDESVVRRRINSIWERAE